jgi:hypothetical protein
VAAFSLAAIAALVGWYFNGGKSDDFDVLAGRLSLTDGVRQSAGWLASGLALALLMLVVRPSGVRWHTRPLAPLPDLLALHWRALLAAYGLIVIAWSATVATLGVATWPRGRCSSIDCSQVRYRTRRGRSVQRDRASADR